MATMFYFANVLVQDPTGQSDSQFLSIVVKKRC